MADNISLDWLSCTFLTRTEEDISRILAQLKILVGSDIDMHNRGFQGYASSGFILGSGRVAYDLNRLEMGVHLSLPSQAIARVFDRGDFSLPTDGWELLKEIISMGASLYYDISSAVHFTRLDFAFDDLSGVLSLPAIRAHLSEDDFTSRFHRESVRIIEGLVPEAGCTIQLGSRQSDTWGKIYDKAAQQGLPDHFLRFEITVKDDRADELLVLMLSSDPLRVVSEYALGFLDFKNRGEQHIKTRWQTVSWWADFLSVSEKLRLSLPKVSKSVNQLASWVSKQISPTLAVLHETLGEASLVNLVADGFDRLSKDHFRCIADFELSQLIDQAESLGGVSSPLKRQYDLAWADYTERKRYHQRIKKNKGYTSEQKEEHLAIKAFAHRNDVPLAPIVEAMAIRILGVNFASVGSLKKLGFGAPA